MGQRMLADCLYSAFQHVIFSHDSLMLIHGNGSVLLRALDRWEQLWDNAMLLASDEKKGRLGIAKYCNELAMLFRRVIELSGTPMSQVHQYLDRRVTFEVKVIHDFIKKCTEIV